MEDEGIQAGGEGGQKEIGGRRAQSEWVYEVSRIVNCEAISLDEVL